MIKKIKAQLASAYVGNFFSGTEVWFVCGMRRSGNHAFINWIGNAIEKGEADFQRDKDFGSLEVSRSGETVFLNEINTIPSAKYIELLRARRNVIRTSRHVILSAEDVPFHYQANFRVPRFSYGIFVRRSLLNLIASRLQNIRNKAEQGIGWSRQTINGRFFEIIKSWSGQQSDFHEWKYEDWLRSVEYREEFLKSFGLKEGSMPGISKEGGGSSFLGEMRTPTPDEAVARYKAVSFPPRVLEMLNEPEVRRLLSEVEIQFLDGELLNLEV